MGVLRTGADDTAREGTPGRPPRRYTYEERPSKCPFFVYRGDC